MTITARSEFLHAFCDTCLQPVSHAGCGQVFHSMLEPVRCPHVLLDTHEICSFCLELHPKALHHVEHCKFAQHQVRLRAGGWSTPASTHVLRSLRRAHFPYREPLINLLDVLLQGLRLEGALLIPIPMSSAGQGDRWVELLQAASTDIDGAEVRTILTRKKQHSTRRSAAQLREWIVRQEYLVDEALAPLIHRRRVALVDDNVTTGTTMIQGVQILKQHHPTEIIPVAVERNVSVRLLQRCPLPMLTCPYYACRAVSM